jgi:phage baseplate assembly protein gpV
VQTFESETRLEIRFRIAEELVREANELARVEVSKLAEGIRTVQSRTARRERDWQRQQVIEEYWPAYILPKR